MVIAFLVGMVIWVAVVLNRRWLGLGALMGHAAVVGVLLAIALRASAHSDGKLLAFALIVEFMGLSAVLLGRRVVPKRDISAVNAK